MHDLPSNDEIRNVGEQVAFEAVRTHNQAWQDYRSMDRDPGQTSGAPLAMTDALEFVVCP